MNDYNPEDTQKLIEETQQYLEENQVTDVQTTTLKVSASNTTGLQSIILGLIGDYEPIVKDYTYTSTQGYTSHSIEIQPDFSWIASAAIFLAVMVCVFKFFGGLLCRK